MTYRTRLLWDGRAGFARLEGAQVPLWDPPALGADPVWTVDYMPGGIAEIQPRPCDPRRAMRADEIAAADALLADLCAPDAPKPMASPMLDVPGG